MKYIDDFQVYVDPLGYMLVWKFNKAHVFDVNRWDMYLYRFLDNPENITKKIKLPEFVEFYRDVLYKEDSHLFNRYIGYQLVLVDTKTNTEYKTDPISISWKEDPVVEKMREELNIKMKLGGGVHGYLFKLKRGGEICECYNPTLKKAGDPNCTKCFGTGIVGGYVPGTEFYGIYTMDPYRRTNQKPIISSQSVSIIADLQIPSYEGDFLYFDTQDLVVKIVGSKFVSNLNRILYQSIVGEVVERYDILRRFLSFHTKYSTAGERTYVPFDVG